jgi:hypothetical protein
VRTWLRAAGASATITAPPTNARRVSRRARDAPWICACLESPWMSVFISEGYRADLAALLGKIAARPAVRRRRVTPAYRSSMA